MRKFTRINRRRRGQTILEYVLIVCIVVVAAVGILGVFSDTVRSKLAGVVAVFGGDTDAAQDEIDTGSREIMQGLGPDGSTDN